MEVKLTTDWIFLHNSEIYCKNSKCYFVIQGSDFQYHLTEFALKTLDVEYECEELYNDDDEDFENPSYHYSFKNIEDIKDTCPELYHEFQKSIKTDTQWREETDKKQNMILKFLDTPKTLHQIHEQIENEIYKKEENYEMHKNSLIEHTGFLINDLVERNLIEKQNNKYFKIK